MAACHLPTMNAASSIIWPWAKLNTSVALKISTIPMAMRLNTPPRVSPPMSVDMNTVMGAPRPVWLSGGLPRTRSTGVASRDCGEVALGLEDLVRGTLDEDLAGVQ